jgi:putative heme iron utilization protein
MNLAHAQTLRDLLETQRIASLGTLHKGAPYVSMVPFAILPGGSGFVIHVSQLSAHTKDMLSSPQVSLLVVAPQSPEIPAQAVARVTIQGHAMQCNESVLGHAEAKLAYLSRFPQSSDIFNFSDFSLFAIMPRSIRFIGGFAQATTITPEVLAEVLSKA